ncbi:hypothetical protein ACEWY4_023695 [Coilia grayii]|uniref:C2H2-type domain-containing protein n=1 Tax=Coilia grayii TaxID=363190 RepID=A0ABD1IYH9_9TELE
MYQNPVIGLDKIRRSRKNVKTILSEFGLQLCQEFSERELQDCEPEEDAIDDTEWSDLTVGFNGRRKKKWKYRTQTLCCSLCKYSARSWATFHGHIRSNHPEERNLAFLSACSACSFIGHPRLVKKHFAFFHSELPRPQPTDAGLSPLSNTAAVDKYVCRKCPFEDTLLYCMKKHVLFRHCINLWQIHAGQRSEGQMKALGTQTKFYCKTCGASAETTEHLVYHLLTSDKHKEIESHVEALIWQKIKTKKPYDMTQKTLIKVAPKPVPTNLAQVSTIQTSIPVVATPSAQLPGGPQSGVIIQALANSSSALMGAQEASAQVLPAQAAALVQLASAEAKGLLRADGSVTLANTQMGVPQALPRAHLHPSVMRPLAVGAPGQPAVPQLIAQQRPAITLPGQGAPAALGAKPLVHKPSSIAQPPAQTTPRATVLTSQSLLSHLIPTGNKVNGMPTYTLAPLQVNVSVQANKGPVVSKVPLPVSQSNSPSASQPLMQFSGAAQETGKTKKWTSCQYCKELFPSAVFHVHMENHKLKSKTGLAAKAPFLKKMPDKTVKCLTCKVLLSEKGLFEHMQHGLVCLYCPGMFHSIKTLTWHIKTDHGHLQKENGDFMRRQYRLYSDESGNLLFPYFDINTTAPKDILGEHEVNLALVTNSLDLIFVKMSASSDKQVCNASMSSKLNLKHCPFCGEELMSAEDQRLHLRERHFITPTIHAILKTPAYKCVYCGGVYTGKTTMLAIIVHLQRCKSAPKTPVDAERFMNSSATLRRSAAAQSNGVAQPTPQKTTQPLTPSNKKVAAAPASGQDPASEVEVQRKMRLEMAVKEAMMANKREREARAARRKLEREKQTAASPPAAADVPSDPSVPLALNPTGMWKRSFEDRREFLTKYFHAKPYLTKKETTALANALLLNNLDVACHFGTKRNKCLRAIQRSKVTVILGFNMAEMQRVKHNLYVPEIQPEQTERSDSESESGSESDQDDDGGGEGGAKQMTTQETDSEGEGKESGEGEEPK